MEISVRYLVDGLPELRAADGKSDWVDLYAAETVTMSAGEYRLIRLGVAIALPDGFRPSATASCKRNALKSKNICIRSSRRFTGEKQAKRDAPARFFRFPQRHGAHTESCYASSTGVMHFIGFRRNARPRQNVLSIFRRPIDIETNIIPNRWSKLPFVYQAGMFP